MSRKSRQPKTSGRWPAFDRQRFKQVTRDGPVLEDLRAHRQAHPVPATAEAAIDQLFPGNPLLCVGRTVRDFNTKPREDWRGALRYAEFIVSSPMDRPLGRTLRGTFSARSARNVGPRRYLVVEFDRIAEDRQLRVHLHLATFAPLVLLLHSGGKSLHAWFNATQASATQLEKIFRYAVSLGADPATWRACQWVRLPNGERNDGSPQPVILFNPKNLPKP